MRLAAASSLFKDKNAACSAREIDQYTYLFLPTSSPNIRVIIDESVFLLLFTSDKNTMECTYVIMHAVVSELEMCSKEGQQLLSARM
jgi:hypothetical protein